MVRLADDARDLAGGRRGARTGRGARPAPRGAVHDQGLARHGRRRHDGRHSGLARPRARARRDRRGAAPGRRRDPAGQDEHARVHLGQRDGQRRLRPDLEPVRPRARRPAAAAAARRRSSPPGARRSTSAATAATASASPRTCAGSPGSSRPAAACRGPVTGRAPRGCSSRSPSWARSPAASRTSSSSCRSSPGRTGRIRTSSRRRSGSRRPWTSRAAGRLVRRQRDPDADARDDRGRPDRGRRDRGDRGDHRGAGASRPRRRAAGLGGGHPGGRVRLAVAAHRAGRDARGTARSTGSGG